MSRDHDPAQLESLRAYEKRLQENGLVGYFASEQELADQVRRALDHDADTRTSPPSAITVKGVASAALLPADNRLLNILDDLLPEDSDALVWLRKWADGTSYRNSDVEPLRRLVDEWNSHDRHFVDDQVDAAVQVLVDAVAKYIDYQNKVSEWAPGELQAYPDNPLYRVPEVLFEERPDTGVQKRLASLADDILAANAVVRRMVNLRGR